MANQRHISPLLFLTPRLPGFLIGQRLSSHGLELLQLDRGLSRLGVHQLNDSELRQVHHSPWLYILSAFLFKPFYKYLMFFSFQACYLRGLNADVLGVNQCREWLSQWLQVSSSLKGIIIIWICSIDSFFSVTYPKDFDESQRKMTRIVIKITLPVSLRGFMWREISRQNIAQISP